MLKHLRQIFVLFIAYVMLMSPALAQERGFEDVMQDSGKLNVVFAVVVMLIVVMIGFLVYLDRRVSRMERQEKIKK